MGCTAETADWNTVSVNPPAPSLVDQLLTRCFRRASVSSLAQKVFGVLGAWHISREIVYWEERRVSLAVVWTCCNCRELRFAIMEVRVMLISKSNGKGDNYIQNISFSLQIIHIQTGSKPKSRIPGNALQKDIILVVKMLNVFKTNWHLGH